MNTPEQITTSNGTILTLDELSTSYAKDKDMDDVLVFRAKFPDGKEEIVIFEGQNPIFSSQRLEDVAVHLDILSLSRSRRKK